MLPQQRKPVVQQDECSYVFTLHDSVWRCLKEQWLIHNTQQMLFFLSRWKRSPTPPHLTASFTQISVGLQYLTTHWALQLLTSYQSNLSSNDSTRKKRITQNTFEELFQNVSTCHDCTNTVCLFNLNLWSNYINKFLDSGYSLVQAPPLKKAQRSWLERGMLLRVNSLISFWT